VTDARGKFNENPLSLALKISYGNFDYFTGGDMTGMQGYGQPEWFDVETPVAKVLGIVEVMTLNHHGIRDATNQNFVSALHPQVAIQQSWCSDHPGMEVFYRLNDLDPAPDFFATNMHEATQITYGPWFTKAYKSMQGHVMVRVMPGGDKYYVFVLSDENPKLQVKRRFGPYQSAE